MCQVRTFGTDALPQRVAVFQNTVRIMFPNGEISAQRHDHLIFQLQIGRVFGDILPADRIRPGEALKPAT